MHIQSRLFFSMCIFFLLNACTQPTETSTATITAFVGGNIIDGTGKAPIQNGVIIIREGRVFKIGTQEEIEIPENMNIVDFSGKIIIPGLINSHAHVGYEESMQREDYSKEHIMDQLALYARYGITTVVSLGEDHEEAVALRDVVDTTNTSGMARLYIAGDVVTGNTPDEVNEVVDANVKMGVDFIKIRVDDNLGTSEKMSEEVYQAVINRVHEHHLMLAAHMYTLEDAKKLLEAGADFLAHSVRDQAVDSAFIQLIKQKDICYCPTLTRDLSTFVYADDPGFFDDPFFLQEADSVMLEMLRDPERQQRLKENPNLSTYQEALQRAMSNLKMLSDNQVKIAMGTDSGVPTRFQGYFEHLEMELMAEAGMSPMQILVSATQSPAQCLGLKGVGTLESGKWADFVILDDNPLQDIKNTRSISAVFISGKQIQR